MATLKHLGSKNADYGAAEQYLLFEHDEFTMKPVLDENGRLIPREDYRLSTLNCGGEDFAVACMRSNLRYEKNQRREDVKSHHYIISFDPRDGPDNGLTVDRAQALGEQFCKEHFPGHQALVCTHPDGHNHSGNIHVHIVINSLRIEEVPFLPYMDRPADTKAGCKHRCTDAALRYFKSEVMEMCHREGLYQIDLLNGSKNRVTDREYWAQKKGQAALDKQNAPMIAGGITPRQTKFETNKEKLRQTLRKALATAASFDEFSSLLLREGVTVKESRGRLSYLTPDRTKPITARKLGGDFDRTAVLAVLEQNAQRGVTVRYTPQHQAARAAEQTAAIPESFPPGNAVLMRDKAQKRHNTEGGDTIADYIRADTTLPAYLPYPRFLLKMEISQTAKLLYALLLDRSTLSQKNGWQDGEGRIFIVYPVAEIAEMLDKGCTAIKGALKELDAAGLLERERRGFSAPNRLYVKVPPVPVVRFSDQLMAGKATLIQSEKRPYDGRKTDPMMVGKPTPNKTNINNLIENQTMRASGEPPTAYGRYENIFLSKDEYDELQAEYPDRLERLIEEMSHYLAASGKAYQNYAAALHRWAANDKKGAVKQGIPDYTCMEGESL